MHDAASSYWPVRVAGHDWRIFVESAPFIQSLVADIRTAKQRAWVEAYSFADDAAGRAVSEALRERAAAGIECRVLYDAAGSYETPPAFFDELRKAGIEVTAFRPLDGWWWKLWLWGKFQRRDHRKLSIIDDRVGYFGGMNIVDQGGSLVLGTKREEHEAGQPPWRDVHVRMTGPQVRDIIAAWDDLWSHLHNRKKPKRSDPEPRDLYRSTDDAIFFFDARPHVRHHRPGPMIKSLIDHSRTSIVLAMAYFLPFGGVLRALQKARRRKVSVRVVVPENSDVPVVQWASRYAYERLLRRGIRIYERKERMLHSKVMIVDNEWSVLGSLNLDPRSLLLNLEFFAIVRSAELATALGEICREEFRQSKLVSLRDLRKRSWRERFLQSFAWTFKRWL